MPYAFIIVVSRFNGGGFLSALLIQEVYAGTRVDERGYCSSMDNDARGG